MHPTTAAAMLEPDTTDPHMISERAVPSWYRVYGAEIERHSSPIFARSAARARALAYLAGLRSPAARKHAWHLAAITGAVHPDGFQHLLGRAQWNPDTLRDRLRSYGSAYLAAADAIGGLDATGFGKKGRHAVGVSRQSSGTAGRIAHGQGGVVLRSAAALGHTLLDRELYWPAGWTADRARGRRAGVPAARAFAPKPALAQQMLARTCAAGVTVAWLTGDRGAGAQRPVRQWLEQRHQASVLAVAGQATVWRQPQQCAVHALRSKLPRAGWQRLSAGTGAQGGRGYAWQRVALDAPAPTGWRRWVVVRRSRNDARARTASSACALAEMRLAPQVAVAGTRWTVAERIQTGNGAVGLAHDAVSSGTGG
ncbi:MAG: IS701 family transposase [Chloroflexales bacterium]|nr:IS701 family transposase [Chloroflexales bacterium]